MASGFFRQNRPTDYVNPDGSPKPGTNLMQPHGGGDPVTQPSGGGNAPAGYEKSNEEYEQLLKKYQQGIDATDPDSIRKLAEAMNRDGIPAEVSKDGLLIRVPGYDGGWVDPRQDKAYVEGRGGIRGWAFQPYYGKEDFDRLVSQGRNPHTGEFVGYEQARMYTRDSDTPGGGPGGGLPAGYAMGSFDGGGRYPLSSVMAPGLLAPWTTPFQAPNVTDDPGYQFRMNEAQKALEKSAAARGTLRTGGFVKDLAGYMQGLASQEYQNAYDRALGEYNLAYGIFDRNQANIYNRLYGASGQGLNAANAYGNNQSSLALAEGNADAGATVAKGNAWQGALGSIGDVASSLPGIFTKKKVPDYGRDLPGTDTDPTAGSDYTIWD